MECYTQEWTEQQELGTTLSPAEAPDLALSSLTAKAYVSTGSLRVSLLTQTLFLADKAKARSIRPVSMQKWEHSLMQKEGGQRRDR